MTSETVYGFWSYTHEDNELDGGNILELARLLKEEYNLLSGEPLELFIDRDGLAWGDEWRRRIDSTLAQAVFFIPIITPRYFKRSECRRELLEFVAKAKGLGGDELLLPILYVDTPGLSDDSLDEAMAIVSKTQYVDWRSNRLLETRSREYRTALNALAGRLLDIAGRVVEQQISREIDTSSPEVEGAADIVEHILSLLPDWLDAVIGDKFNTAQFHATSKEFNARLAKLRRSNAPAASVIAAQLRFGKEMIPLSERFQREAQVYARRSIELDPLISSIVRLLREHRDIWPLVSPVREAIDEAMSAIETGQRKIEKYGEDNLLISNQFYQMRHLGKVFQKCAAISQDAERLVAEGNSIVKRWDAELVEPGG